MPISIPTSVAGISVPGTINGPLQLLYGNKYKRERYNYPRNLGTDATRSHVIKFTTRIPDPKYKSEVYTNGIKIGESVISGDGRAAEHAKNLIKDITAIDIQRIDYQSIALYVPDTVNVSYGIGYEDLNLTSSLGKAYFLAQAGSSMWDLFKERGDKSFEQLANQAGSDPYLRKAVADMAGRVLGMENLGDLALRGLGQAMNPQLQVLFQGVGFRMFQFDFVFTPYSKEETNEVREIIKVFKYAAAPKINPSAYFNQGLFMDVPWPFKIEFFYKGQENKYVHRIGESVLENINVDYGPNGWSTFNDGSPVQIKMTLQFKETVIVDKTRINEGF